MSIFGQILRKIFPADHPAVASAGAAPAPTTSTAQASPPQDAPAPTASQRQPMSPVDVADVLKALATVNPGPANWKTSIVDLMKLLGLDSGLAARKELAGELGYTGDTSDTATMNVWLHKQVMAKLAANGGIVPDDMKH
jgi:pyruvate/2-oxoglutarate dehydrogenase complex dihydrolipoamide acyltransferase (E2) component